MWSLNDTILTLKETEGHLMKEKILKDKQPKTLDTNNKIEVG